MTRYLVHLEYDGTGLIGWQQNKFGPSVQSILADAIESFCGTRPIPTAAGRTDSGVHALAMPAHFDLDGEWPADRIVRALNFYLNDKPVSVLDCEIVPDWFSARYNCIQRRYKYVVLNRYAAAVLDRKRVYWVPRKLKMRAMRDAAKKLVGTHDFTSFRATQCQAKDPVKTLDECKITKHGDTITFEFAARSFLHHQVRNMVGTLIQIGLGHEFDIDAVFAARSRAAAGPTAPAHALYFVSAEYSNDVPRPSFVFANLEK